MLLDIKLSLLLVVVSDWRMFLGCLLALEGHEALISTFALFFFNQYCVGFC